VRLSRDDVLKAEDLTTEEVDVPEWGGSVLVRGLSGRERDEFEASMMVRRGKRYVPDTANVRAKIVARCVIGDDGERLFTDSDVDALGEKSGAAIDRVYEVAARLSGLSDEDIEEIAENFGGTPSTGSPSPSRGRSAKPGRNSSPA
jgi:ribosomal protein L12E/L44/L45/RPP1/RPP2